MPVTRFLFKKYSDTFLVPVMEPEKSRKRKKKRDSSSSEQQQQQHFPQHDKTDRTPRKTTKISKHKQHHNTGSHSSGSSSSSSSQPAGNEGLFAQLRSFIDNALTEFLQASPFENLSDKIGPTHYNGITTLLAEDILSMCGPYYGVHLALTTVLETLRTAAMEAISVLARKYAMGVEFKRRKPLTLTYKHVYRPNVDFELVREDQELASRLDSWMREVIYYDKDTNFIRAYEQHKLTHLRVLVVTLGSYTEPILTVLMPCASREYVLAQQQSRYLVEMEGLTEAVKSMTAQLQTAKAELSRIKQELYNADATVTSEDDEKEDDQDEDEEEEEEEGMTIHKNPGIVFSKEQSSSQIVYDDTDESS